MPCINKLYQIATFNTSVSSCLNQRLHTNSARTLSRNFFFFPDQPNFEEISTFREILFMIFMCMSQLITQAAVAQTMNTSIQISETFNVGDQPGEISWFSAAFSMTVGTFILISGRIGDMYGYKKLFIIGYVWFGVFSLMCGFAGLTTSTVFFDIMRAFQGIGPAIMMPNTQALIGSFYPESKKKNICMACFGAVAPSGFILGALFSGLFTVKVWWAWSFWVCGIIGIALAVAAFWVIPKRIGVKSQGSFDYLGSIFGVSGLIFINFSFNQGPNVGWEKPYVYVLLIVGFLCIGVFYFVETKVKDPLVPPSVLKGDTGFILGCIAAGWSCFGIWLFYMFRWALLVDESGPIMAAVLNITTGPMGFIAAIGTAILLTKIPSAVVMFLAMIAFLVGSVLMGTRPVGQIYWAQKFVSLIIQPLGMDMSFPAACILLSSALPRRQQGIAGSLVSTFVNYSISIGLGFAGTVERYTTLHMEPGLPTTIHGMRNAFYMGMGLAGLGVVLSTVFIFIQLRNRSRNTIVEEESIKSESGGDSEVQPFH
ncbi:uncharacterized protein SPAPADRAFT_55850 [Spathaspora passalidarum NRRL Y-27907]|uniref:Major facilitator superfamily (MFS) profile domain-containing protein n=1 Tax=Spathaspora passalidarum (strain NRRL Y-27907 / 11-Y1) TaxID=619300 RepID=G3AMX4_SPAPN|nr:uncharacterized protein SPAPADRAFT_55850 [Spathaspora passalidarum NRRL Y-27907]EGW32389.1 hypothetical protein SPAPADRAFT_55850 [Spathaspora passalidarum NRRL Y-27907]